jgi:carbamoyltransferase
MTITYDCTDYMKKVSPAAIHVDGTARPQIIDEETNSSYYKILKEYHRLTGIPSIINTSFNMHEEPIVCTPNDAIRAFKMGHLDYLAIGDFLAVSNEQK